MTKQATKGATAFQKPIVILDQCASRSESERIAAANGGRLMSVKEFILAIKDPTQYNRLKGDWYWTADIGLELSGYCKIDYDNGAIVKVSELEWEKLPYEQRAYAHRGSGPVVFDVLYYLHRRLVVHALTRSDLAARVAYVGLEEAEAQGKTRKLLRMLGIKV